MIIPKDFGQQMGFCACLYDKNTQKEKLKNYGLTFLRPVDHNNSTYFVKTKFISIFPVMAGYGFSLN